MEKLDLSYSSTDEIFYINTIYLKIFKAIGDLEPCILGNKTVKLEMTIFLLVISFRLSYKIPKVG